jgi:hypothetical protein
MGILHRRAFINDKNITAWESTEKDVKHYCMAILEGRETLVAWEFPMFKFKFANSKSVNS